MLTINESKAQPQTEPLPPVLLRKRVSGTDDPEWYTESGRRTVDEWARALAVVGGSFADFRSIVDFGCGCGRSLRHLRRRLGGTQFLTGMDVDPEAISWLRQAYPDVRAMTIGEVPPTGLETASVDLVLCHSVFTHLPEDIQLLWLAELARVLAPGGILVASIHGIKVIDEYRRDLEALARFDDLQALGEGIGATGFFHAAGRTDAERSLPAYYGAAFHHIHYIINRWLGSFTLQAWLPVFALDHQDVLVLRRADR